MKELLYEFNNKKTTKLGGGKYRFTHILSPSFKISRDGNIIIHETRQSSIKYLVPDGYEGKVTNGNWEDIIRNVNKKTFNYEIETELDLDLQNNQEVVDTLADMNEMDIVKELVEKRKFNGLKVPEGKKVIRAEEILNFRRQDGRIVSKLRLIRGFDNTGKIVPVKSISRLGNKINIEFEKEVSWVDPQWSDQPDATDGKDARYTSYTPDSNFGNTDHFEAGTWSYPSNKRSAIEFTDLLNNVPVGAIIDSAKIELYCRLSTGAGPLYFRRITSPWVETEITWNNQPSYSTPNSDEVSGFFANQWYEWNVKDIVQHMRDNSVDYGFNFICTYEDGGTNKAGNFWTSDYGTAEIRPKIEVNYRMPIQVSVSDSLKINDLPEVNCSFSIVLSDSLKLNELLDSLNIELSESLNINSRVPQPYSLAISENLKIDDINITYRWGMVYFSFRVRKSS